MYNNFIVETSSKAGLLSNKVNIENGPFLNFCFTRHANTSIGRYFSGMSVFFPWSWLLTLLRRQSKKIKAFTRE